MNNSEPSSALIEGVGLSGPNSDFSPAGLWNRRYRRVAAASKTLDVRIALSRADGICFHHDISLLQPEQDPGGLNFIFLERTLKFLLWQRGGSRVHISGCDPLTAQLSRIYSASGPRSFDADFFGRKVYGSPLSIQACRAEALPPARDEPVLLGGHLDGCRIGFDLGGSDRKCAALIDGKLVFSEEIPWDPYFQKDPQYHLHGIQDSLERAAAHLPRVDAIGGSAAGVYVQNQVRVASLFRGIPETDFDLHVRDLFLHLKRRWNHIPFEVVNDGEVTALAGAVALGEGPVLGISMGTSLAAGYCDREGRITSWLNELAFAPVDYAAEAPVDEWSGDRGCGVQYFSQQGVARLAREAGYAFPEDMPLAERLVAVQTDAEDGNPRALGIFDAVGRAFGHALAHYADFYDLRHVLVLGRVTSGCGGTRILEAARKILAEAYPDLHETLHLSMPDEKMKRHGQAVAAASLPALSGESL